MLQQVQSTDYHGFSLTHAHGQSYYLAKTGVHIILGRLITLRPCLFALCSIDVIVSLFPSSDVVRSGLTFVDPLVCCFHCCCSSLQFLHPGCHFPLSSSAFYIYLCFFICSSEFPHFSSSWLSSCSNLPILWRTVPRDPLLYLNSLPLCKHVDPPHHGLLTFWLAKICSGLHFCSSNSVLTRFHVSPSMHCVAAWLLKKSNNHYCLCHRKHNPMTW